MGVSDVVRDLAAISTAESQLFNRSGAAAPVVAVICLVVSPQRRNGRPACFSEKSRRRTGGRVLQHRDGGCSMT